MVTRIVISENKFNIPIGKYIHYSSYVDVPNTNNNLWKTISYWIYKDGNNNLITIPDETGFISNHTKNIILLSNCKFAIEGEEYWKVFYNDSKTNFHQLEFIDGKHYPAKIKKPYRDIVYGNTNLNSYQYQRFKTINEANEYIEKIKDLI